MERDDGNDGKFVVVLLTGLCGSDKWEEEQEEQEGGEGGGSPRSKGTNTIVGRLAYFIITCHPLADDGDDGGGGGGGGGNAKRHCNQLTRDVEG